MKDEYDEAKIRQRHREERRRWEEMPDDAVLHFLIGGGEATWAELRSLHPYWNLSEDELLFFALLRAAAGRDDPEAVRRVLSIPRADVNAGDDDDRTALMTAAEEGSTEAAQVLIESGADVNGEDLFGASVLSIAVSTGNTAMARLLIEAGACDDGGDALAIAVRAGNRTLVEMLTGSLGKRGSSGEEET